APLANLISPAAALWKRRTHSASAHRHIHSVTDERAVLFQHNRLRAQPRFHLPHERALQNFAVRQFERSPPLASPVEFRAVFRKVRRFADVPLDMYAVLVLRPMPKR